MCVVRCDAVQWSGVASGSNRPEREDEKMMKSNRAAWVESEPCGWSQFVDLKLPCRWNLSYGRGFRYCNLNYVGGVCI